MQNSPILVTGAHRSGSTWVGQVLASAPGTGYLHEPFNPIYAAPTAASIDYWFQYIGEHNHHKYFKVFRDLLNWQFHPIDRLKSVKSINQLKLWLKYAIVHQRNKGKRVILKDPIALFSTEWLTEKLAMKPLILVRHPGAFAYSLKRKQWAFPFHHLLSQPELMEEHLQPFAQRIEEFSREEKPILEQACLLWSIMNHFVKELAEKHPNWIVVKHEDLSANPESEFQAIFRELDLEYTDNVKAFIRQSSSKGNAVGTQAGEENLVRDSRANIGYWKEKLTTQEATLIKEKTSDVWPVFYQENSW